MMECYKSKKIQNVVPVFYNVLPADVRKQRKSFGVSLNNLRESGLDKLQLETWKLALHDAANLVGFHSADYKDDLILVEDIATSIIGQLEPAWRYDVFLSSCESDHKGFSGQVYATLKQKGISTFAAAEEKDTPLRKQAVKESRLSVVVISHDFPWDPECLQDLVQIIECMDKEKKPMVLIFHGGVEPACNFDEAFAYHHENKEGRYTRQEIQTWKSSLIRAFSIDGWHTYTYRNEIPNLVQKICEHISDTLLAQS